MGWIPLWEVFWGTKEFAFSSILVFPFFLLFFHQSESFVKTWDQGCNYAAEDWLYRTCLEIIFRWLVNSVLLTEAYIQLRANKWPRSRLIPCQGSFSLQVPSIFPVPFALPFLLHMENLYQDGCHGNEKICMCLIYLFKYLLMVYNYYNTSLQLCSSLI